VTSPQGIGDVGGGDQTLAMVLTHNAPESLQRCLSAIAGQSQPPAAVLVVDMASAPPVDASRLSSSGSLPVSVLRSEENLGPAGGWAMALAELLERPQPYAWVMDDDIVPEPDCLEHLWLKAATHEEAPFVFPLAEQRDGTIGQWGSWCGFLIDSSIVREVGLPNADLFWWAEDSEYCQWRIPQAGHPRRVARKALVHHDGIRQHASTPTWKYYYETRNSIYLHFYVMHRVGLFPRNYARLIGRALWRERSGHLKRVGAIARGTADGVRGRLGIRYPVTPMKERATRT
jgi:rhamnopyranosyl-N-acetylglucosaminyl-diphospho-decaprenol beta-1,3/1,4-galactofuranosyltransferase